MVRLAVDAVLMAEGAERKEQLAAWTADKEHVSSFAMNLQQIDNGVTVPPSGWQCTKCDKKDNLWLNLTDGMILCGKKNCGYACTCFENLSWLTYCGSSDVFSYPEDESVLDPLLAQHLAFFGIDFSSLQKEVEPIFGPGFTGIINLGNSCYLAATMQVVFSTHSFCSRTKLAHGLLSRRCSVPALEKDEDANSGTLITAK